ncbi:MAG: DUF523 domain-containing protein [Lachnospiraceae bacterium]|jgi:uncharacterized protein YbbK (DUF523 family)
MKIMISACLLGENCKYDGGNNYYPDIEKLVKNHEVISVCPEVLGGLPVPRIPCEIVDGVVLNAKGTSWDREFREGAEKALEIARKENVDMLILQSRSPSCGVKQIYDGTFSGKLIPGKGVFAELMIENGFKVIDVKNLENEDVLR